MSDGSDSPADNRGPGRGNDTSEMAISVSCTESFENLEYHRETGTYRAYYDADIDSPSMAVVSAVAAVVGDPVTTLPPLQETIDPDALDKLWTHTDATANSDSHVSFSFVDHTVELRSSGLISIEPPADEDSFERQ